MKRYKYFTLLLVSLFWACFDDKGNYDYMNLGDIVIDEVPDLIEVLSGGDTIVITPKVKSTLEGEITNGNPFYEFVYKFDKVAGSLNKPGEDSWVVLNPDGDMNLNVVANFPAGSYIGCFVVKDLRNDLEYSKTFDIKISSSVYEGWMVLCNEGDENRIRLDMISRISAKRMVVMPDVLTNLGLPEGHNATQIGFAPSLIFGKEAIYIMGETGTYKVYAETFETDESWNMKLTDFIMSPDEEPICFKALCDGSTWGPGMPCIDNVCRLCVTTEGNVFAITSNVSGSAFEMPINTSTRGGNVEYKVAPFIGVSMMRPGNAKCALMYDVDNLRFVGWVNSDNPDAMQTMAPLQDPTGDKLFSFQTGKELLHMESTSFSGGMVYSVLQDNGGNRSVYGINAGGVSFRQELYYKTINAPEFNQATKFAFHSQYPFMFYAVKNKVYLYDLGTGVNYPLKGINLGVDEDVTLLKFNLYEQPDMALFPKPSDDFFAKQYDLIVASYDKNIEGVNGGKVGFYRIDHATHSVKKIEEYVGFAKVEDVVYRERR